MLRKSLVTAAALGVITASSPASATWWKSSGSSTSGWHTHSCTCGHITCNTPPPPPPPTGSSGYTPPPPPPPPTTSGTQVPEPGMLGLTGLALMGLGALRMRRRKVKRTIDLG